MKVYKVATVSAVASGQRAVQWAGSQAEARQAKKELCERHGLKQNGAAYDSVDVPSGKEGLLAWLNKNFVREV